MINLDLPDLLQNCRRFGGSTLCKIAEGSLAFRLYARNSNLLHNKLAKAAKIVAKRSRPPSPAYARAAKRSKEAKRSNIEIKRHDDRMKSARYKLEAFIRDYSDVAEWKEVSEAIKKQLGGKHV